ncbi:MAG: hypothetical protein AAGU05_15640, partial [Anaerolineaceae bacterium]
MKILKWLFCFSLIGMTAFNPLPASTQPAGSEEPYTGDTLCLPGAYLTGAQDCLPYGPSSYITQLAQQGIEYPMPPLNGRKIDAALGSLDYSIAKINVPPPDTAAIYGTLDDAINGANPIDYLQAGQLLYVAYSDMAVVDGKTFVLTSSGGWMRASPASYISFRGVTFTTTPHARFGWIVESTYPLSAPSYAAAPAASQVFREELVQIYDEVEADQTE